MRVFISWSGARSRAIAELLHQWLPLILQDVRPYFSPDDVTKGVRWESEIVSVLEETRVGILCLTDDNLHSPWLMFEAGALSKSLRGTRICPLLFGIEESDVPSPLTAFRAAEFNKAGMKRVIDTINNDLAEKLSPDALKKAFDKSWPQLESSIRAELEKPQVNSTRRTPLRSQRELLEDILQCFAERDIRKGVSR